LLECSVDDKKLFEDITRGLPDRAGFGGNYMSDGGEIPHGSGAHVLQHIRAVCEFVKPTYIFEIGTNRGHSAAMFLELSRAKVLSIDISTRKETLHAVITLKNKYHERFDFLGINSAYAYDTLADEKFDLAFIDGAHDKSSVLFDINTCKRLNVPYILFDDIYPRYGSVLEAIGEYENELELFLDMDNLRLYKTKWNE
jgi:hypothetical protein